VRRKVTALYPVQEVEQFTELFWQRIQTWRAEESRTDAEQLVPPRAADTPARRRAAPAAKPAAKSAAKSAAKRKSGAKA
jgi:hypothetical protein